MDKTKKTGGVNLANLFRENSTFGVDCLKLQAKLNWAKAEAKNVIQTDGQTGQTRL